MEEAKYPMEQALDDVLGILMLAPELLSKGCACCGAKPNTLAVAETKEGVIAISRVCGGCSKQDGGMLLKAGVEMQPTDDRRRKQYLGWLLQLAAAAKKKEDLPLVARPPRVGGYNQQEALVCFMEGKKLRVSTVPFPWSEKDPQAMTGKIARDVLAMHRSILAGETTVSMIGSGMVVSASPELVLEWMQ